MFSNIMLATDFSPPAMLAAGAARELAKRFDARCTLVHVVTPTAGFRGDDAEKALLVLREERMGGVDNVDVLAPEGDRAAYAICAQAGAVGTDLIVAGRHGEHNLSERLIGTTTERIARHAPCSVLSAHPAKREPLVMMKQIIVATDFSEHALPAVRAAAELAKRFDAWVKLVHVYDLFPAVELLQEPYDLHPDKSFKGVISDKLEELRKAELDGIPSDVEVLRDKSTVRALCTLASDTEADLLVLGTHGLTGVQRLLLGSVAERVIRHAPCSVLVVRP